MRTVYTRLSRALAQETDKNLLFETRDGARQDQWIHRSYMAK